MIKSTDKHEICTLELNLSSYDDFDLPEPAKFTHLYIRSNKEWIQNQKNFSLPKSISNKQLDGKMLIKYLKEKNPNHFYISS